MIKVKDIFKDIGLCITFSQVFSHIFKVENIKNDFKEIAEIGYSGIELSIRDIKDIDWKSFDLELNNNNLRLITLSTGLIRKIDNISLMDKERNNRKEAVHRVGKMIEHLNNYNGNSGNILIGYLKGTLSDDIRIWSEQLKLLKDSLGEILDLAEKKKVRILIEVINQKETNFINRISEGVDFISDFNSDYLKLIVDSYHMSMEKESYNSILKAKDYIGYVHLGDSPRFYPGSGNINFKEFLKSFYEIGYDGVFSMEFNPSDQKIDSIKKGYDYVNGLYF
jgi:sugar phosphate isomerase/epimerase